MNNLTAESVSQHIYIIRGMKVMIDSDLAELYGVSTKNLNKAVERNLNRFPDDFMFRLNQKEYDSLRFQIGTSKKKGGRRYLPYVFSELGVSMLSSVLRSEKAIQVNIFIMRTFVKIRESISGHSEIIKKLTEIENIQSMEYESIVDIVQTLKSLLKEGAEQKDAIGFLMETE